MTALLPLPPGAVSPGGWLADQLRMQADGLTGHLEEIWPDVGPDSGWLGGAGESWERGPYYLDGLIPLAHAIGDAVLLAKAQRWVEAILASQREDGFFGPAANDDWWPRMVALKALTQHADATGDERVLPFVLRYFRHQDEALDERPFANISHHRGVENVLTVAWAFLHTREDWLFEFGRRCLRQSFDWCARFDESPEIEFLGMPNYHETHVVNIAMGLKDAGLRSLFFPEDLDHRGRFERALANLQVHHGLVHGMFSGDENLAGRAPTSGVETCAVVEFMFTLEQLLTIWGDPGDADLLERVGYNLLPAALTSDLRARQYHQQANQVLVSVAQRDWTTADDDSNLFGLETNFGCCTANLHQGWPKLLRACWMQTPEGGLAAIVHGPSSVRWTGPSGDIDIETETAYPFDETLRIRVVTGSGTFPLLVRIPGWCTEPTIALNGVPRLENAVGGFLRIEREWIAGDNLDVRLPMLPALIPRGEQVTGVSLGPLVLALSPGEIWDQIPGSPGFGDWEVRPRRSWRYGISADSTSIVDARVERFAPASPPFGISTGPETEVSAVPLKVWVPFFALPRWEVENNSLGPVPKVTPDEYPPPRWLGVSLRPLVPYGSARLRVAEFPRVDPGPAGESAVHW